MMEGYITIPMAVLDGWVGHHDCYLKWWTWLRREASWTEREVWFNRQQVYLQPRQVIVTVNLLVKQWQVSKPTVIRFLQRLEDDKLIVRQTDSRKTIITITPLGWADLEVKPWPELLYTPGAGLYARYCHTRHQGSDGTHGLYDQARFGRCLHDDPCPPIKRMASTRVTAGR